MSDARPAWSQESAFLQMPDLARLERFSPEWALEGSTGRGVRVAVIDSGIDATHPDLDDCIDVDGGRDFSVDEDGNVVVAEGPHDDVFGHGTACAGIIHALAPDAMITSVRVLGPGLRGKAAAFHAGLQWAVDEGFDVINLSLGAGKRDWALAFHEVCDRAYFGNSFIVTAANNIERSSFPSLYASVTSVACNTTDDPLRFHFNPDPPTEFLARGIDVEVPWLNGESTVTTGNSFAAPHIAGFAALVKAKHPELRPFHVKAALWACAANVRDRTETIELANQPAPAPSFRRTAVLPAATAPGAEPATEATPTPVALAPSPMPTLDDITIGAPIAEGAWGTVWTARRSDGSPVAVRRVDRALANDPALLERFLASVRAAATIDHPHVLPIEELIEMDDHVLIVMPHASGNLAEIDTPATTEDACLVALSLLSGLNAAHRAGVFHGDVRPRNALIDGRRRIVTSDVGLAAPLQSNARTMVDFDAAEWQWRAPELATGGAVGAYTDVYAVGAILWNLLTGDSPYPVAGSLAELATRAGQPIAPGALPSIVPPTIATTLGYAVAFEPAYRWASVADFAASLHHAAEADLGDGWMWRSRFILDGVTSAVTGSR